MYNVYKLSRRDHILGKIIYLEQKAWSYRLDL